AQDGIRHELVTGVQTCALPISRLPAPRFRRDRRTGPRRSAAEVPAARAAPPARVGVTPAGGAARRPCRPRARAGRSRAGRAPARSEERRVGREGRLWGLAVA